ncbi:MAG: phenylalanine--tRNA ligase subunit beta [Lactococcus lactis]|uniref:Phenylalanine--tRNA ligase beta subunit n=2 Tax=Lactococcus lactis subsp. cremoris TaxID=1359 RepID=T0WTP6_LACLC|nr:MULTISPECIES: phenylalanine--tRNA ligase subunit beta [Lactococcus]EQC88859.1 phenylalanyl-tRNA synthase subunit beta [Lactococcus cremoris subsp. cremoris TIFN1]EQC95988.1 phenylalanyl-tRNA synthase subunit beta [Lactococcus cremoris subsp. cremoris TIFN3]AEU41400.1 Phenylalanyl-tRNA synthetase beta chain [Lactococcus cremoris subsp. cremoris A76]ARE19074.2 phenylalanine--tRNA ligase subunit beta [Lactococcus cremoris]AXN66203.1 phenylalanyl-tRNA synthetase beta subunit [Lactococcus cremor
MLVSYKWLKELVPNLTATPDELEQKMSTSGIEVEGVTSPQEGLSKLVVGEVLSSEDIPETHLHITQVNVGADEALQIVCGAPNVRVGMKVIVALVGARIADNYKIKKGKIRGVESLGMLCALDEIGIDEKINPMKHEDGIFEMPADAKVGDSIFPYLDMDDEIIELSITPNRADALSMNGAAWEVGAIYDLPVKLEEKSLVEASESAASKITVKVETDKVPTYKIRLIEGVKIAKSPQWLQNRLMNAGVKPINNVVDVTNYVLMTFGQPLHSFDFAKFGSDEILVRQAKSGEKITTLDHVERELDDSDIVVTANGLPVALGGVMGGADSEITDETTNVALEAALFDGASIRKTSQKFALRSEASSRFEKGINEGTVREALDFAAAMIVELAGGKVLSGLVESNDYQPLLPKVSITLSRVNGALGTDLSLETVKKIFVQLGFGVEVEGEKFTCEIPSRRWDIHIEADLVEEVARIYGYDNLPSTLPLSQNAGELTDMQKFRRTVRTGLESSGLNEVIGYSLVTPEKATEFVGELETTSLMMPMTEDRQTLRANMIPGLLDIVNYNQNRKNADVAIYEIGNIFLPNADDIRPTEVPNLAFAISGNVVDKSYNGQAVPVDFYYAKGIVENLLETYEEVEFVPTNNQAAMHPGRTAVININGRLAGFVGQIHPATAKKYDVAETYVASLDMEVMLEELPAQTIFNDIPKVQAVHRDIALLIDAEVTHAQIVSVIKSSRVKTLKQVELFDIYQGKNLPAAKKSMAYSLTFQPTENTMTDDEITAAVNKITKNLVEKLNVEIR